MKNKFLSLALLSALVVPQLTFANCEDAYRAGIDDLEKPWRESAARSKAVKKDKWAISSNVVLAGGTTAVASPATAYMGFFGLLLVIDGGGNAVSNAMVATEDLKKQISPVDAINDMKVSLELINQANTGDGNELRSLTKEINNRCTHKYDQPLTDEMVAQIIVKENEKNTFCPKEGAFFQVNSIKRLAMIKTERACN